MKYLPIFTLEIFHNYYADRRCSDFEIEPTPATQKLLADCRCVIKSLPNGLRVLITTADGVAPLIPLPDNATFAFHLRQQNPNFVLFTDSAAFATLAAPLYTNNGNNADLVLSSRTASTTERFSVVKPSKTDAFTLSGRPLKSVALTAFQISATGGAAPQPVSYDETAKVLRVNSANANAGTSFTVTYPTAPALPPNVFADVEIKLASLTGGGSKFQIVFKAKQVRWKYYVVTSKSDKNSNIPSIEDKDKAIVFENTGRTNLTQAPDPSDRIATQIAEQYPNMQAYRLASNALVPCQETARKTIQLQMDGEKVLDALPNPALQNYSMDTTSKEDSLYQIVKYFTQ